MEPESAKLIAAAICVIGFYGAAKALGKIFSSIVESIARNPSAENKISKYAFIGAGFAESMGLFSLVIALIILFS